MNSECTVQQLLREKASLELEIAGAVGAAITVFANKTGVSVERVVIEMVEITIIGDLTRRFVVGGAEAGLAI